MTELDLTIGQEVHGFVAQRVVPLPELNATLYQLEHVKTGARYLHVASADDNNLFAVGFRTPPRDSTGVPHILEHTALCGSRRYPVRDPFFSMLKRSLSTFMNAMTGDDWTVYPFSSQNRKDFYNLMGVYLDAVFFPLLREMDFRQEGHRLEFADPKDPDGALVIKGVVYNEMKGYMSDPYSLLSMRMAEALYPTTAYGKNSGGEPAHIPDLTWEALRAFHADCYHPSNAYFFSYGDLPLEPHLEVAQERALKEFERIEVHTAVADEVRFSAPRRVRTGYPVDPGEPTAGKSMVQVGWLTCNIGDELERMGMGLLSTLLLGNPAAPLYKALLDSKLGANLAPGTGYGGENRETVFAAGLQGTEPDSVDAIEDLILSTLGKVAEQGFHRDRIDAAIQQLEFAGREVRGDHYPYALGMLTRIMGPWIHGADPARPLLLAENLERLRAQVDAGPFFEDLIRRQLLENPHRVTLTLSPDPAVKEREEAETAARLERLQSELSAEERRVLLQKTDELAAAQGTNQDLSVLPNLELSDIPREERPVPSEASQAAGESVQWFDQPTNGIGYFHAHLETEGLPEELSPYLPLFCVALTQVGAAGQPYTVMAERIAAATGGIRAGLTLLDHPNEAGEFRAVTEVEGKALERNQSKMFGILEDILGAPGFDDRERLHTVFNQLKANLENSLPAMGHRYAARVAAASLTPASRLREHWAGVEHIRFVREIAALGPAELGDVSERLGTIAEAFLRRNRIRCGVTGEKRSFAEIRSTLGPFLDGLPGHAGPEPEAGPSASEFVPNPVRVGLIASLPVSYVVRVFSCVPYTHPDSAGLMVLAKLLRAAYLHREIREKGGAYGGMATYASEAGLFSMLSYRDPHLARTLKVYDDAARWAAAGSFGDEEVKEAILGVFSDLDKPLSPGGKGAREFANTQQGLTLEMRQALRERVLATEAKTLSALAEKYFVSGRTGSAVAVIAGEEALRQANEELGEEGLALERI